MPLRDYQERIVEDARGHMRQGIKRLLLEAPTGSGKTHLSSHMMQGCAERGWPAWFMVHREELLNQTAGTFRSYGLPFGINGEGGHGLQLWSVPTLANRRAILTPPRAMFWDECHHLAARTWDETFQWAADSFHIGLSATPVLPNGKPMGRWFQKMVNGPTVPELIAGGNLSDFEYFAPDTPDLSAVRETAGGEFNTADVEKIMRGKAIVGSIVNTWHQRAFGRLTIGFAPTVKSSKMYVEAFQAAGVIAAHLDGDTPSGERRDTAMAFAHREITMLWNVDLFGEGFDLASLANMDVAIECGIMARPTKSFRLKKQQDGRILRLKPDGSKGIILDHCGNWLRHGLPDDVVHYTLDGKPRRKDASGGTSVAVTQCESCYMVFRPEPACPFCGHVRPIKERPLVYMEGELKMIERDQREREEEEKKARRAREKEERAAQKEKDEARRKEERREEGRARTIEELVALGEGRGYKNSYYWAQQKMKARHGKRRK